MSCTSLNIISPNIVYNKELMLYIYKIIVERSVIGNTLIKIIINLEIFKYTI